MRDELKGEINQMIIEALTINDEVLAQSDYVVEEVKQRVASEIAKRREKDNSQHLLGEFGFRLPIVFDDKTWTVDFIINYQWFKNMKEVKRTSSFIPTHLDGASFVKIVKDIHIISLSLELPVVGDRIMGMFPMVIQHELNHIYQQIRMGKTYPDYIKYTRNVGDMRFGVDGITRVIATLIYRLHPSEQDSFVNGMYSEVREKWYENPTKDSVDNVIKSTQTYELLRWCRQTLSEIRETPDKFADAVQEKGYKNVNDFIEKMTVLLKRYQSKFAHCVIRIKGDCCGITDGYMRVNFGSLTESCKRGEPIFMVAYQLC